MPCSARARVRIALLLALALCPALAWGAAKAQPLRLTLLHQRRTHSHIQEFNRFGQTCTPEESAKGECFGGYPRLAAAVAAQRAKGGNILLLDAGDQFQGTLFYTLLKGRPNRECMNALRYNAMTLGNHPDSRLTAPRAGGHLPHRAGPPVLAANVDASGFRPWPGASPPGPS